MSIKITCINKQQGYHEDPHHAISHLGWVEDGTGKSGKSTRLEIYDWIKDQNGVAYITDSYGNKAYLMTKVSKNGTKFVQTVADGRETNNLLNLPECTY